MARDTRWHATHDGTRHTMARLRLDRLLRLQLCCLRLGDRRCRLRLRHRLHGTAALAYIVGVVEEPIRRALDVAARRAQRMPRDVPAVNQRIVSSAAKSAMERKLILLFWEGTGLSSFNACLVVKPMPQSISD